MSEAKFLTYAGPDGEQVATRYVRRGGGTPLVLIHGVGMALEAWAPQLEALSPHFDVIAYDMLGHGGSSPPAVEAQLFHYTDQLRALLDRLGIEKAFVAGHSMGALVALEFTLSVPERVLGVVALNAVYCRTPEQRAAVERRASLLAGADGRIDHSGAMRRWFGEPVAPEHEAQAHMVLGLLDACDPKGYQRAYQLFASLDDVHRGRLGALAVPALFMTSALDPNSTPQMSREMAAATPRGRCEVIDGERHMMNLTAPDVVNARLLAFLSEAAPAPILDAKELRRALGAFVTGVTVVSARQDDGQPRGFTANSFTSVSLDPPLVLVCIARTASSYQVFSQTPHFSVSILAAAQKDVSSLFASKAADKFAQVAWTSGPTGSPVIAGAAAWFDCRRHDVVDAGDHVILIGRVMGFSGSAAPPLGYCRGAYVDFALSQEAIAHGEAAAGVGAILERDGCVVLLEDGAGGVDLPLGRSLGAAGDPRSLKGVLSGLGLDATLDFLFAVFENAPGRDPGVSIYYRGTLDRPPPAAKGVLMTPFAHIPWARLKSDAVRDMLKRFVRERQEDAFGIYVGDAERGNVRRLAGA